MIYFDKNTAPLSCIEAATPGILSRLIAGPSNYLADWSLRTDLGRLSPQQLRDLGLTKDDVTDCDTLSDRIVERSGNW